MHGLISGFGKGLSSGAVAVVNKVGGHHPERDEEMGRKRRRRPVHVNQVHSYKLLL